VGSSLGTAIIGSILIASIAAGLAGGVGSSRAIDSRYRAAVSQEVRSQASSIEFGAPVATTAPLTSAERSEIKLIANRATVKADRLALLFTLLFTIVGFLLSARLPNTRNLEHHDPAAAH
jgi:hypothetical protein